MHPQRNVGILCVWVWLALELERGFAQNAPTRATNEPTSNDTQDRDPTRINVDILDFNTENDFNEAIKRFNTGNNVLFTMYRSLRTEHGTDETVLVRFIEGWWLSRRG
jgi:hypothetical protein